MAEPDLVARCVEAMVDAGGLPVTVKHRIGINDLDSDALLTSSRRRRASSAKTAKRMHAPSPSRRPNPTLSPSSHLHDLRRGTRRARERTESR